VDLPNRENQVKAIDVGVAIAAALICSTARAGALELPFDFSRGAVGLNVTVNGSPLYVMLDTGVDPSLMDIGRADAVGLKIDRGTAGEASGYGEAKSALVYATTITGLEVGGRKVAPIGALAADLSRVSAGYGRTVDGILGYSFLNGRVVLIDYPGRTVSLLDRPVDATPKIRSCKTSWSVPLRFFHGDNTPILPNFRFAGASGPVTLDTGSNGGISLFPLGAALPGVRGALAEQGDVVHTGARGDATSKVYVLNSPVGFGPFTLPAGQMVKVESARDGSDKRAANVGNEVFATLKLKVLLNYRDRKVSFYGNCST
jgi:hypothetical protein